MQKQFLTMLVCVLAGTLVQADDWTEFRGPTGQGLSKATALPLTWTDTENVAWKTSIPGSGWSSPIVAAGKVYLTTAVSQGDGTPPPQSLQALCLDAQTGATLWTTEVFKQEGGGAIEIHKKNSHASPTPVLEGDHLYVHFGPAGTACLTTSGEVVWRQQLEYKPTHGNGGSPALAGDVLILCCDGRDVQYVAGLNKQDGSIAWKTDRDTSPSRGFSFCTPTIITVQGRDQAVCPGSAAVFAYDPRNGKEIWRVDYGEGYSVVPRPVFGNGLVYVCSGFGDQRLLAIDPTGTGDVTDTHVIWEMMKSVPRSPSLLLVEKNLFVVDDRGIASCVDATNGDVHWQERLGGNFSASPLYAAGRVYFQNESGVTTVIAASTEYEELAKNRFAADRGRTFASSAVSGRALFLRSEENLYRLEEQ